MLSMLLIFAHAYDPSVLDACPRCVLDDYQATTMTGTIAITRRL
jgi:hypothetical protein